MMKFDEKKDTLYLCDPQKNTECPKRICHMPNGCFLTTKEKCAKIDERNGPIIVTELQQEQFFRSLISYHPPTSHALL